MARDDFADSPNHYGAQNIDPSTNGNGVRSAEVNEIDDLRDSLTALSGLAMNSLTLPQMLTHIAEFAVNAIPGADALPI
jgi:hypothetical protein